MMTLMMCLMTMISFGQEVTNDTIKIEIFNEHGLIYEILFSSENIKDTIPLLLEEGLFYIRCNKSSNLYINSILLDGDITDEVERLRENRKQSRKNIAQLKLHAFKGNPGDLEIFVDETKDRKFIPLAIVYTINPILAEDTILMDSRLYGGGFLEQHHSCYDYSFYDGEITDFSNELIIQFPKTMIDEIKNRYILWDDDIIKLEGKEKEIALDEKINTLLTNKCSKFSLAGTTYSIEVYD